MNTSCSHMHSFCAADVSRGLATKWPWLECHRGVGRGLGEYWTEWSSTSFYDTTALQNTAPGTKMRDLPMSVRLLGADMLPARLFGYTRRLAGEANALRCTDFRVFCHSVKVGAGKRGEWREREIRKDKNWPKSTVLKAGNSLTTLFFWVATPCSLIGRSWPSGRNTPSPFSGPNVEAVICTLLITMLPTFILNRSLVHHWI